MSDAIRTATTETSAPASAPTLLLVPPNWKEQQRKRRELAVDAFEANRTALFDALVAAGIVEVTVEFDGEGDSGQIEDVTAQDALGIVALPDERVEFLTPVHDGSGMDHATETVGEAIETLCYTLLSQHHGGWEINDGSYGLFAFDVAARTIELTHNERYIAVDTTEATY